MTSVMRAFSIIGVAMVAALVHSWLVGITIAAEGNEKTAQERFEELDGSGNGADLVDPVGQDPDPIDQTDPAQGTGGPVVGDPNAVSDPSLHIPLSLVRKIYADHIEQMTGEALLIDARGTEGVYEQGHIWGAEHITTDILMDDHPVSYAGVPMGAQERMALVSPDQWVIIYCGGGDCDESENLRTLLVDSFGLTNVWIFEAGYPGLEKAGLQTIGGSTPFGE